jgi:hypothetical protein
MFLSPRSGFVISELFNLKNLEVSSMIISMLGLGLVRLTSGDVSSIFFEVNGLIISFMKWFVARITGEKNSFYCTLVEGAFYIFYISFKTTKFCKNSSLAKINFRSVPRFIT